MTEPGSMTLDTSNDRWIWIVVFATLMRRRKTGAEDLRSQSMVVHMVSARVRASCPGEFLLGLLLVLGWYQ